MHDIINMLSTYLPFAKVQVFIPALILIGFSVGVISSFFGIGGAWMVTPGLNILGFPMTYAIGTDIAHVAGKSIFATRQHSRMGNVDYKLALVMVVGTVIGVECGAQVVMYLKKLLILDSVVRWAYAFLLLGIGIMVFIDCMKSRKNNNESGITWYKTFHKIKLPPVIHFSVSNITCSIWLPIIVGLITGFLAGFLGIGGGLFRMPALIYFVGCPTIVAVGTDLFEVMISGVYGAITYSQKGCVDFLAAGIMLTGAIIGTKIGAMATKYVNPIKIRYSFAFAVFGCLVSVVLKQLTYKTSASIMIFTTVISISTYIIIQLIKGILLAKRDVNESLG